MMAKSKCFPLSLSSVVHQKGGVALGFTGTVVMPQTATRNAAQDGVRFASTSSSKESVVDVDGHVNERLPSMVSEAIRKAMVERIATLGVKDTMVLTAMATVPRHMFIEPGLSSQAYSDVALPIGYNQTISQPYIVARMIELLCDNQRDCSLGQVLEIGTGCGYQAAVLSLIAKEVYSIERIKPLHELARSNLRPLRIANIRLHYGDGMLGLPQAAPFDGIILAAAGQEVPQMLLEQMAIGGRLVAPVGSRHQVLQLIQRISEFEWNSTTLEACHFVPLRAGTMNSTAI